MHDFDWDHLRYFVAAAESGSLTSAAKALGTNQSTVGRQIDALESSLGVKLFQRSVKGLVLTEEGERILCHAQTMRSAVVKIQRSASGADEHPQGSVRLSLPEGLCVEVLLPHLAEFHGRYPDINLILDVSSSTSNLTRGDAEIAIRLFRPKEADLVAKCLGQMRMGLFASRRYIENQGQVPDLEALKTHRVITYGDELSRLPENQWLLRHTETKQHIVQSDNTQTRLKATVSGVGISIQPQVLCARYTDLIPVLPETDLPGHKVWVVYHKDLRDLPRIRVVVDFTSTILGKALA